MSNPYRVVDIYRNEFEVFPDFVTPRASSDQEIRRRMREGKGMPGIRSEYTGLLRMAKILELAPSTDHKTLRFLTNHLGSACIGAAGYDLFVDETNRTIPQPNEARTRKPVRMPRYDLDDPEQRPTAIQLLDETVQILRNAAAGAKRLPKLQKTNPDLARSSIIHHGRTIGAIGYRLACWSIADELAYEGHELSNHAAQHVVREHVMAQKSYAKSLASAIEVTPSIRQLAHPYSPMDVYAHTCGIEIVKNLLKATEDLTIPS